MKKRVLKKQMKKWIRSVTQEVQIDIEIKHSRTGINMCYEFIQNQVLFDSRRLIKAKAAMSPNISLKTYIQTITLHELGHYLDRQALLASLPKAIEIAKLKKSFRQELSAIGFMKMKLKEHEINIVFEETAWDNAEKLNLWSRLIQWKDFMSIRTKSLQSYRHAYQRDIQLYGEFKSKKVHSEPQLINHPAS